MVIRTTEQIAPERLSKLIAELSKLTTNQPTTAEIEEAFFYLLPQIDETLRSWFHSRQIIQAQAHQAAIFAERHPGVASVMLRLTPGQQALRAIAAIPVCTPEEDAAFEAMAARQINPIFGQLLAPMNRSAS